MTTPFMDAHGRIVVAEVAGGHGGGVTSSFNRLATEAEIAQFRASVEAMAAAGEAAERALAHPAPLRPGMPGVPGPFVETLAEPMIGSRGESRPAPVAQPFVASNEGPTGTPAHPFNAPEPGPVGMPRQPIPVFPPASAMPVPPHPDMTVDRAPGHPDQNESPFGATGNTGPFVTHGSVVPGQPVPVPPRDAGTHPDATVRPSFPPV